MDARSSLQWSYHSPIARCPSAVHAFQVFLRLTRPKPGFEAVIGRYQHRVYDYALHYLRDADDAADVTQDVLVRLWQHRDGVDEDRALGWLLRVTRNACIDRLRNRHMQHLWFEPEEEHHEDVCAAAPDPHEAAVQGELQQQLAHALSRLPEPQRSIVYLREVQDLTYDDISTTLDLPLNTVKVYLHRGRQTLRKHLTEVMDREPD